MRFFALLLPALFVSAQPALAGQSPTVLAAGGQTTAAPIPSIEVKRSKSSVITVEGRPVEEAAPANDSSALDEGPVWKLIEAKQYGTAYREINRRKAMFPSWQPSPELARVLEELYTEKLLADEQTEGDWERITQLPAEFPKQFDCGHLYRRLKVSDAWLHFQRFEEAVENYDRIFNDCTDDALRLQAMEHGVYRIPDEYTARYVAVMRQKSLPPELDARVALIEFQLLMRKLSGERDSALLAKLDAIEPPLLSLWQEPVVQNLAWTNFENQRYAHALELFQRARAMVDSDSNLLGELMSLNALGRHGELRTMIEGQHERIGKMESMSKILPLLAAACADQKDEACQLKAYNEIESYRPLHNDEIWSRGWVYYHLGSYAKAADDFELIYRQEPTESHAKPLYLALSNGHDIARARAVADEVGGPIRQYLALGEAEDYFYRKLYHKAQAVDEHANAALANLDSDWYRGGYMLRHRGGNLVEPVKTQFSQEKFIVEGGRWLERDRELNARIEYTRISAGVPQLVPGAEFGTFPVGGLLAFPLKTQMSGFEWSVGYRKEGWFSYYGEIGQGFIGGPLKAPIKGKLGVLQQYDAGGSIRGELFRQPVHEFLVSYAGSIDPFSGRYWGGVSRSGGRFDGYNPISGNFGVAYQGQLEWLTGTNVATNRHVGGGITLPYNLQLFGNSEWGLGPQLRFERYRMDQGYFTFGHGAYFSPQRYTAWGLFLRGVSIEPRPMNYEFTGFYGRQAYTRAPSPVLPLTPNVPTAVGAPLYPGMNVSETTYNLQLRAIYAMGEHWQLGAEGGYAKSSFPLPGGVASIFQDYAYMLYLTWSPGARNQSLSSDYPAYRLTPLY